MKESHSNSKKTNIYLSLLIGSLLLLGLYLVASLYSYLLFHSLAEIFSIVIAFSIFILAWNCRNLIDNQYLIFLGVAFLFIGFIDTLHTLAYAGMGVFLGYGSDLPTQLWIAARYLQSISLLIACFIIDKKKIKINFVLLGYTIILSLLLLSIFYWKIFPACFIEGTGLTPFKKISEYIISLILATSVFFLLRKKEKFDSQVLQWLVISILLTVGSELAFTFYISVYGLSNLIGHIFKIISFYFVYRAIVVTGLTQPNEIFYRNLQESEEKLSYTLAATNDGIWDRDLESGKLNLNNRYYEMLGYHPGEIVFTQRSFEELMHPEDKERVLQRIQECIEGKTKNYSEEFRLKNKSGQWKWTLGRGNVAYRDSNGKALRFLGTHTDISRRKEVEESLRKSRQKFDSLFRNSPEALVYLDDKGTFLDANLRFCELFGYSLSEIKGRNIDDGLIHPPDKIEEGKQLSIKGLSGYLHYETIRKKKDGTLFPVSMSATSLAIDGQVKGQIGVYIDISERVKLQNALQESEEKFHSISALALDAIFFMDHTGSISYYNQAAEKMFGYSKKEMLGKDLHQILAPLKYHHDAEKGFLAFQKSGKGPAIGKTWELSAIKKTGEEFSVALSLSAVKLKGKWNAIGSIRDISSQKQAEEKLEKLARIDALTGCYNRRYGLELLDRQIKLSHRSKSPLLLAFLDIDKFKSINDAYGHNEGDLVLKEVTGLFKSTLREIDIVCRMGGDEFLIIFPDNSLKEAPLIKERLNKDLTELNQTLKKPYQIALSIGLSEYDPDVPLAMDELIRIADQKMYEEKKSKKQKRE